MSLTMVADPDPDCTMWVDGYRLGYGPAYVLSLSEAECIGVIAHEVSHCTGFHFDRQGQREHDDWNVATDLEINPRLIQAGFTLPGNVLNESRFHGMAAEQIYKVVHAENKKAEREGKPKPWKPGPGEVRKPVADPNGQPVGETDVSELAADWQARAKQALGSARAMGKIAGGHIPTELEGLDIDNRSGLTDWRPVFRAWIDDLGSRVTSYATLDRRGMQYGLAYPGSQIVRPSCIAFLIDVSSSMDVETVRQAIAEAQSALDDGACDEIELVYVNTVIKARQRFSRGQTITLRVSPSGGTDFTSAMAVIGPDPEYVAVVFLTDGGTSGWGADPGKPCLWGITAMPDYTARLAIPYGDRVCLYSGGGQS